MELEMGYSADEFERVLPLAMRDWSVTGQIPQWHIGDTEGRALATVRVEPRPERVMGSLRLPVLLVRIAFNAIDEPLVDEFVQRFERGFHRGGG
jgi:hypothetical protein